MRCLGTTPVASGRMGRDSQGGRDKKDLNRVVRDEQKGVFRVLDIGKPKIESYTMARTERTRRFLRPVAAPPRYSAHNDVERCDKNGLVDGFEMSSYLTCLA